MSVIEVTPVTITKTADADLSAKQYHAVKFDTTDGDVVVAGAGDVSLGILQNTPLHGELADIAVAGGSKAECGASVTQGQYLKPEAGGQLIPVASNNDHYIARALEDGDDGDIISVIITSGYYGA